MCKGQRLREWEDQILAMQRRLPLGLIRQRSAAGLHQHVRWLPDRKGRQVVVFRETPDPVAAQLEGKSDSECSSPSPVTGTIFDLFLVI